MSPDLSDLPLVFLAVGAAIALGLVIRSRPRVGLLLWLVILAFVPVWMGVTLKLYFMPVTLVGIVALLGLVPRLLGSNATVRLGVADLIVAALVVSCLVPMVTGGATRATIFVVATNWLIPFLVGRLFPKFVGTDWIYSAVAVTFAAVAVGLLIEFLVNVNPFVTLMPRGNSLYETWGTIQVRGDHARAEWAFGHSIAAGSAVALAMPMTIASKFPTWLRMLMVVTMGAGVVVTLSRVSMIGAVLGVVIMAVLMRELAPRIRAAVVVGMAILIAALGPFVSTALADAGSEAANSASYRSWLLSLVPHIAPLGFSPIGVRGPDGVLYFGNFQSIDSELIYLGLLYGWFALVISLIGLLAVIAAVVARRAKPATVALAAQIPTLATVAFITQYTDFFWFVVGLAAYTQSAVRPRRSYRVTEYSDARATEESGEIISEHPLAGPSAPVNWRLARPAGMEHRSAVGGNVK
jgi:hypothetical protein